MKKEHLMRGFKRSEIIEFFIENGARFNEAGLMIGRGFKVFIGDESAVPIGRFFITEVKVVVSGVDLNEIEKKFFYKFLRAGG
ncbi:MAG: hypothetical protein HPY50_01900 [Firmicutes bacterium]|nr:hypothetical protein [Bacillota bacterium]